MDMPKRYNDTTRETPKKIWCNLNKFILTMYKKNNEGDDNVALKNFLSDYETLSNATEKKEAGYVKKDVLGFYIQGSRETLLSEQHAILIEKLFGFANNSLTSWEYFEERFVKVYSTPWAAQDLVKIYEMHRNSMSILNQVEMCSLITGDADVLFGLYGTRSEFYTFTNSFLKDHCSPQTRISSMTILERHPPRDKKDGWPYRVEYPTWLSKDWKAPTGTILERILKSPSVYRATNY